MKLQTRFDDSLPYGVEILPGQAGLWFDASLMTEQEIDAEIIHAAMLAGWNVDEGLGGDIPAVELAFTFLSEIMPDGYTLETDEEGNVGMYPVGKEEEVTEK